MGLFQDKKGAELSLNVVIIAILAILVLVVVAFILTGGASKFTDTVKRVINPVPKANDLNFAVSECKTLCSVASTLEDPTASDYCRKSITYQYTEEDGTVVDEPVTEKCWTAEAGDSPGLLKLQASCDIKCEE
jgi:hypothetical protein